MRAPFVILVALGCLNAAASASAEDAPAEPPALATEESGAADAPSNQSDRLAAASDVAGTAEQSTSEADRDGPELPDWLKLNAEYRMRTRYINPLDLSTTRVRNTTFTEHRGRIHLGLAPNEYVSVHTRVDLLDGVLWGDNGVFRREPSPNSGVSVATHQPNSTALAIGLPEGADPLDPDSYVPVLQSADVLQIDHLYADIVLPIGLLRIGRQPNLGQSIASHDGERGNRWGVANFADGGDRILFATKLDEAVRLIAGGDGPINTSLDEGVFLATWYEFFNQGSLIAAGDNLRQIGGTVFWLAPELQVRRTTLRDISLNAALVNVGGDNYETNIFAIPFSAGITVGPMEFAGALSMIRGRTREISEGFAALAQTEAEVQRIRSMGARATFDFHVHPRVMLTAELNYASGDDDPRAGSDITSYAFARDSNVGLLLFEEILAYETARSAAVGIENLRNVQADSFPITEAASDGRFGNAIAAFPQALFQLVNHPRNQLHTRLGALLAWTPAGVVDPILTSLAEDGNEISDDAVNYHGGSPGSYYGTELDLQIGWTYHRYFVWTVEGAVLFPGDALQDEHGQAVNSFFVENRFEVLF